jgi:hypothetical protein
MIKNICLCLTLIFCSTTFGQTFYGQIVTLQNDTLNVQIKTKEFGANVNRLISLQEKIKVIYKGSISEYLPKDIKSFKINIDIENFTFDNVDDNFFAQRLYAGKVKLYKFLKKTYTYPNQNIFRIYLIKKPNVEKTSDMVAMGLSRLITKKDMLPAISDCKYSYGKIENDEIKIKDENILVEFIKDYELNCFSN